MILPIPCAPSTSNSLFSKEHMCVKKEHTRATICKNLKINDYCILK